MYYPKHKSLKKLKRERDRFRAEQDPIKYIEEDLIYTGRHFSFLLLEDHMKDKILDWNEVFLEIAKQQKPELLHFVELGVECSVLKTSPEEIRVTLYLPEE